MAFGTYYTGQHTHKAHRRTGGDTVNCLNCFLRTLWGHDPGPSWSPGRDHTEEKQDIVSKLRINLCVKPWFSE